MIGLTRVADFFDDDHSRIDAANCIEVSEEEIKSQNGNWLQNRIDNAKSKEVIHL